MTTIKVSITTGDINHAPRDIMAPQYCWMCPVGSALLRATDRSWEVRDGVATSTRGERVELPDEAVRLVKEFDAWTSHRGPKPEPMEFEVTLS